MSSRKVQEVIFTATARDTGDNNRARFIWDNPIDLDRYCTEHAGEKFFVHVEPMAQVSEKLKLYAFYHKVILRCAVLGYTAAGYSGLDEVHADYLLRAELAKDFVKDPSGNYIPIVLDKRNMTKARLHKFVSDCIFFIEETLQQGIPDSQEYKLFKETGKKFKPIK